MPEFRWNLALSALLTNLMGVSAGMMSGIFIVKEPIDWVFVAVYILSTSGLAGLGKSTPTIGEAIVKK